MERARKWEEQGRGREQLNSFSPRGSLLKAICSPDDGGAAQVLRLRA